MEISNEHDEVRLVLVGRTGTGISSTGNTILNKDVFKRSVFSVSVTEECKSGESIRYGTKVIVVDTPGLFNNKLKHNKVKKEISKCMNFLSKGPHAFIYIFRISRHSKEEEQTLVELEDIFGRLFCKYCILLFVTDNPVTDTNTLELVDTLPNFYRELINKCNGRVIIGCTVAEHSETTFPQIRKYLQEIAQQEPSYYSIEMFSETNRKIKRMLIDPAKSMLYWFKQKKTESLILLVFIILGGCSTLLYNFLKAVSQEEIAQNITKFDDIVKLE